MDCFAELFIERRFAVDPLTRNDKKKDQDRSRFVVPGCALLGAGPESTRTIVVMDSGLALRAPRNDEKKRPGSLPAFVSSSRHARLGRGVPDHPVRPDDDGCAQFNEARFGGEAGHDLIKVS
jgi:hypothetical protein